MNGALNPELRDLKTQVEGKSGEARQSASDALSDSEFWRDSFGLLFFVLAGVALLQQGILQGPTILAAVRTPGFFQRPEVKTGFLNAGICAATVTVLLAIYHQVLRPQIILDPRAAATLCPDRWAFNNRTGKCEPRQKTDCPPFYVDRRHPMSRKERCEVASKCGTNWGGACS